MKDKSRRQERERKQEGRRVRKARRKRKKAHIKDFNIKILHIYPL